MRRVLATQNRRSATSLRSDGPADGSKCHIYKLGEAGSGTRVRGEIQDFYELRDKCIQDGVLFEDPIFPASESSLFFTGPPPGVELEWKRPTELVNNPKFFVDGASRFDVCQGSLGDCWMLASISELTMNDMLFYQVVPTDQSFTIKYAGIFHFRFWQYGRWIDVVIDDKLPVAAGTNQLFYLHSKEKPEFWTSLMEKAYAKLYGCYECLIGGLPQEALEDFTGGISESYSLDNTPQDLWKISKKSSEMGAFLGAGKLGVPGRRAGTERFREGLVDGHAYSITAVTEISPRVPKLGGKVKLMRLRNPWGQQEWTGPWSDNSEEWNAISESKKKELGLVYETDGEFWMTYDDFVSRFDLLEICHLTPDSVSVSDPNVRALPAWYMSSVDGAWVSGVSAGGLCNDDGTLVETINKNPQYCITLSEPDDDDEEGRCTMLVATMQKNRRNLRVIGKDMLWIGTLIFHISDARSPPKPLDYNFISRNHPINEVCNAYNVREVTSRLKVPPGKYVIVPGTQEPDSEGEFLLRVFTEKKHQFEEYDKCIQVEDPQDNSHSAKDERAIEEAFCKVSGDDVEINWKQMKKAAALCMRKGCVNVDFSDELCRSLLAMMDVDKSGKLSVDEFKILVGQISKWKNAFANYDGDRSGNLDVSELRETFEEAGFNLNSKILNAIVMRYGNDGKVSVEDFIQSAIKLKSAIDKFQKKDLEGTGKATVSREEWVESVIYG